jgi:hypothetical protein
LDNGKFYDLQKMSIFVALSIVVTNEVGRQVLAFLIEEEGHITLSAL